MSFADPAEVETAFYHAFQELDTELMAQVWSDLPESACVHPGGDLLRGRSAVLQSWSEIFASAGRPSVSFRTLQTTRSGDIAIHLVEEIIRPGSNPDSASSRVLATNIYQRTDEGWSMMAHHASLPVMGSSRKAPSTGRLH